MSARTSLSEAAMLRLFALALLVPVVAFADPVKKDEKKKESLYFPVTVGTKRVVEVTSASLTGSTTQTVIGTAEATEMVTGVEVKNGVYTVTLERTFEKAGGKQATVYEVTDKGVVRPKVPGSDEPMPLLMLGGQPGDTWTHRTPGWGGHTLKRTFTLGREEEVEVPAGKYKAIKVESVGKLDVFDGRMTEWYAPGVGVVKSETRMGSFIFTSVLKEFTPGKEEKKDK